MTQGLTGNEFFGTFEKLVWGCGLVLSERAGWLTGAVQVFVSRGRRLWVFTPVTQQTQVTVVESSGGA